MQSIITKLANALKPDRVSFPTKIFMCGGAYSETPHEGPFRSMRDHVYSHMGRTDSELFKNIILADSVNLWLQEDGSGKEGAYKDILELEEDLAGLVSALPLFVESAGSYAELGSFVLIPHISDKLILFVADEYREQRSFIGLGPILRLENDHPKEERVHAYMWPPIGSPFEAKDVLEHIVPEICQTIKTFASKGDSTNMFNAGIAAHMILLICDVISLLHICRINEIEDLINGLALKVNGAPYVLTRPTTRKYLLIAQKLDLIAKIHDGNSKDAFFVALEAAREGFIEYRFAADSEYSTRRAWKIMIAAYIDKTDARRKGVRKRGLEDLAKRGKS